MLVLLGGMILLQAVTTMYLVAIRGPKFLQGEMYSTALAVAREVQAIDMQAPVDRPALAARLTDKTTTVHVVPHPPQLPASASTSVDADSDRTFSMTLRAVLGPQRAFTLHIGGIGHYADEQMYLPPEEASGRHIMRTFGYALGVPLDDGTWAVFERRVVEEAPGPGMLAPVLTDIWWRFVGIILLVLLVVRWVTHPMRVLAQAADEFGANITRSPLPERGPTETLRAIQAFNRMQRRIMQFMEERNRMLAAISHDLKTPVTRLRLRSDLIEPAELRQRFVDDLDELRDMLALSLDFVRSTEGGEPVAEVDLNFLLESMCDDYAELGHTIHLSGDAFAPVRARPGGLKRCLANLLDNAVRYGGVASITVTDKGDKVAIAICDQGPGIPEASLNRVFEPFFRVESSRNQQTGGHGLGLSIARNIALQHGGDITLANRPEGGLQALLTLPRHVVEG